MPETLETGTKGPRPIIKWAGGKNQLIPEYSALFPYSFKRYHEPFFGGGAVFFHLSPREARLTDINGELINTYTVVRDRVEDLIASLSSHRNESEYYYALRALDPGVLDEVDRASRFIFLNKTCYNGLYRVNRSGAFNVPFGRYAKPNYSDSERLRAACSALQGVHLQVDDFSGVLREAAGGDFVYLDPPYQPVSLTANFTGYSESSFGEADQRRLAKVFRALDSISAKVMLSNSDTPLIRELYAGYQVDRVLARRAINCKAGLRGPVHEVVVRNY